MKILEFGDKTQQIFIYLDAFYNKKGYFQKKKGVCILY